MEKPEIFSVKLKLSTARSFQVFIKILQSKTTTTLSSGPKNGNCFSNNIDCFTSVSVSTAGPVLLFTMFPPWHSLAQTESDSSHSTDEMKELEVQGDLCDNDLSCSFSANFKHHHAMINTIEY